MLLSLLASAVLAAPPAFLPKNRPYDVERYRLELRLDNAGALQGKAIISLKPGKGLPSIELDAYDLTVASASVGGQSATFKVVADPSTRTGTLTLTPKAALPANKEAVVEIVYSTKAGTAHEGLFMVQPEGSATP